MYIVLDVQWNVSITRGLWDWQNMFAVTRSIAIYFPITGMRNIIVILGILLYRGLLKVPLYLKSLKLSAISQRCPFKVAQ